MDQRRPKMTQHGHTITNTTGQEEQRRSNKTNHREPQTATTTGCSWCLPPLVVAVARPAVLPSLPPIRIFLLVVVRLPKVLGNKSYLFLTVEAIPPHSSIVIYLYFIKQLREGWRDKNKICERDSGSSEHRKIQAKPPN